MLRFALGKFGGNARRVFNAFPSVTKSVGGLQRQSRGRMLSTEDKGKAARAKLMKEASTVGKAGKKETYMLTAVMVSCLGVLGVSGYLINDISSNPKGSLAQAYHGSLLQKVGKLLYDNTLGHMDSIFYASSDKLLPDWPTAPCYANIPPGTPCPPLLVLDLERTLMASTYDSQYGWRHVKRPGVEKFLKALSQYYEIVIFSENDMGVVQEIMLAIDPERIAHTLGSNSAEARGQLMLKRLDFMNRDISRIILLDDSEESSQLFPRNTLLVPPFTDVNNKHDRVLENLIPLLQAFVHDGATDFRNTLEDLGTNDAEEAVAEYRMRLREKKAAESSKRNRGLGRLIRGVKQEEDGYEIKSAVLSPSDIVGGKESPVSAMNAVKGSSDLSSNFFNKSKAKPSSTKKPGMVLNWVQESQKAKDEEGTIRQQKMQEIFIKRQEAKQKKA
ncbi:NLI interacting factor-like phosphatase-domain-containing protein [Ochromonadaceae sp. CCMP2298]|nr:NLI interacting factor-like phosphatase-domain-containing protein [Ochromonadaceae sp. CCMP2298]|mmetsp:Transcript_7050/g.15417  ORF Transcript_7050/g.15417 Transcript_7050/m.15417 type:complete len:445 (-) Transcript_7050:164-1498(-)|eukprot:CAMPEP_0173203036 /NCGR_PEP_ID=MMETSP1141-20130122/19304_1 /TAXON_ID=483371 /ORGANISM="non described non described, Strain CCMP2298" /LENGTH=444 /DNA_ID=CAMNT_0014128465 /DNA_START=122 /DNA_END=1456 /DNA_ORIENTATION=+